MCIDIRVCRVSVELTEDCFQKSVFPFYVVAPRTELDGLEGLGVKPAL